MATKLSSEMSAIQSNKSGTVTASKGSTASPDPTSSDHDEQRESSGNKDRAGYSLSSAITTNSSNSPGSTASGAQKRFQFYQPASEKDAQKENDNSKRFNFYNAEEINAEAIKQQRELQMRTCLVKPELPDKQKLARPQALTVPALNSSNNETDEILRSLQETEEQRNQLLTPSSTMATMTPCVGGSSTARWQKGLQTVPGDGKHSNTNAINPYEDAIKEALVLLRKHRKEGETTGDAPADSIITATSSTDSWLRTVKENSRPKTPREADRVLQSRGDEEDSQDGDNEEGRLATTAGDTQTRHDNKDGTGPIDASDGLDVEGDVGAQILTASSMEIHDASLSETYEEQKQKAEERKKRMDKYTTRLQEFKSNMDASPSKPEVPGKANNEDSTSATTPMSTSPQQEDDEEINEIQHAISNTFSQKDDEESAVQRGVESVLLAILERAHSSRGRAAAASEGQHHDAAGAGILEAMEGLLKSTLSKESTTSTKHSNLTSASGVSSRKNKDRSASVVDELLAEEDEAAWEEKKIEGSATSDSNLSEKMNRSHIIPVDENEEETDDDPLTSMVEDDDDDGSGDGVEDQDDDDDDDDDEDQDDTVIRSFDDGVFTECDDDINDDNDDDDDNDPLDGVLGPLSKRSGGTTGVVLESSSQNDGDNEDCMKNTNEETSSVLESLSDVIKGAENMVSYMTGGGSSNQVTAKMPQETLREYDDTEAMELMRTLCAHLLPFGVDGQSNQLLEAIPAWDENDPNEAGYRIIRLTKLQLLRVERAFEWMINELKVNSEKRLNGTDVSDPNFERELQEAEKLLDDEERRVSAAEMARTIVQKVTQLPKQQPVVAANRIETVDKDESVDSCFHECHPDFPGIKGAGKGEMGDLEYFHLPILFKSHVTGFEPTKDLVLEPGNVVAGQYLIESELGTAAFSTAYRCTNLSADDDEDGQEEVCLKVIKNTKDFFDQSLDEIKILELLRQTGRCEEHHVIEMKTFFYHREHLVIVTELLRQNLFEFGKFVLDNNEEPYFTIPRLAYITRQCFKALKFVHGLGLVHSDVKPENILLGSYSRAQAKIIDFGSSCYLTDRQSSYIQSRSYRAPEVILGLPYDGKIDVWSLGCVVAEMFTGDVTFQNDSIVSMLSRIEAICGPFPRHMIAQGGQSGRFFTKSGLLYENVNDPDQQNGVNPLDEPLTENDHDIQFDIFQPKTTCLSSRLGFEANLMDDPEPSSPQLRLQRSFTDFVSRLLTIDPDGRPTAEEALQHPWMVYASTLSEEEIKYPSS